jgi:hypothetical protein
MMKVKNSQLIVGMLALSLAAVSGYAQSQPSAKATAKVSNLTLVDWTTAATTGWQTLLENTIKTANMKDLFISASFEVGLYTDTVVKSKNMVSDTSTADAAVRVRVLLDGTPVEPGTVTYGRRKQTLSATLEGAIGSCLVFDPVTQTISVDEDCVQPEIIQLILETLDAASFNFVAADVAQGVHTIEVQAAIENSTTAQLGSATAKALVGKGAVTVESVRLIKNEDVVDL